MTEEDRLTREIDGLREDNRSDWALLENPNISQEERQQVREAIQSRDDQMQDLIQLRDDLRAAKNSN